MSTYTQRHPVSGVTYVYSREKVFDEEKGKNVYVRRLIGKLDANGNQIPTGKVGRPPSTNRNAGEHRDSTDIDSLQAQIKELTLEVSRLKAQCELRDSIILKVADAIQSYPKIK